MSESIPNEYEGWWRIIETSQWVDDELDILGPALLSLTGSTDRLRMHCLLAYVNYKPIKTGVSFTWEGAWEYDQVSGSGRVTLGKEGAEWVGGRFPAPAYVMEGAPRRPDIVLWVESAACRAGEGDGRRPVRGGIQAHAGDRRNSRAYD